MKVPIRDLSIPAHSTLFENGADSHLEYTDSELSNDSLLSDVYASSHDESDNDEDFEVRRRTSSSKSKKTSETAAVKSSHVSRGKNKPAAVII